MEPAPTGPRARVDRQNVPRSFSASVEGLGGVKRSREAESERRAARRRFRRSGARAPDLCRGVAKLVKASDFDSDMRGFESFLPCQTIPVRRG